MCTNEKLYMHMPQDGKSLVRRRSKMMTPSQIRLATDCLRVLANRRDVSIGEMSQMIRSKKLYPTFYSLLDENMGLSKMKVVNQMQKSLLETL